MATQADIDRFDALMTAGNYGAAAALASGLGVDPGVVANYVNERFGDQFGGTTVTPEVVQQAAATYTPPPPPPPAVDPVAQQYVNDFNALINQGNYEDAARLVKSAELAGYGEDAYRAAAVALDANTNLPPELNFLNAEGIASIKDYVANVTTPVAPPSAPAPVNTFDTQLSGLFSQYLGRAPTDRELGVYRKDFGAEIDPTEITEFLRRSQEEIRNRGNADVNALFEGDKIPTPDQLNQVLESSGGFGAPSSLSRGIAGIPRFAAQEFTPLTFAPLRRGATQLAGPAQMTGLTSGQPAFGGTYDIATRPVAATPFALPQDFVLQTGAYGAPIANPITIPAPTPALETPANTTTSPGTTQDETTAREGGMIKMAEGGEAMPKLSASEAGSKFDISKFIDEQGRLVGGYSRPIRDQFGVITGYDYRPYERDVVFNPRLAEAEARGMSDEEREAARRGLIVRQGLTGVDPYAGGLAGIQAREALMRSRPQYYSYAEGGLADVAQNLADRGRKGDSMLVHMAPEEVSGLRALARAQGNDLTINPRTGLPEAFSLKKLFKAASFILPFVPIPGLFGMSSLLTRSILSGIASGASAKGGFDLKQALGGGLKAYALGSLGEKLGGGPAAGQGTAPTTTSVPDAAAVTAPTVTVPGVDGDISLAGSYTGPGSTPLGPQSLSADLTAPLKVGSGYTDVAAAPIDAYTLRGGPQTGEAFYNKFPSDAVPVTGGSLPPGADTVPGRAATLITPEGQGFGQPLTKGTEIAMAGLGGLSIEEGAKEQRNYEIEAAAARREDEERKRRFDELFARTLGNVRTAKEGGSINLAGGGMTYMEAGGTTGPTGEPRVVQGTGDGMSDSVPATIEGVQEARLANDEFVIPADVVSDIGNGSSDAGAKKLYGMMDRIRKARHGTTKQPPEINAERMMPA